MVVEPILIALTRGQIVRLYKRKPVQFIRNGKSHVVKQKENNRIAKLEAKIARDQARLSVLKSA